MSSDFYLVSGRSKEQSRGAYHVCKEGLHVESFAISRYILEKFLTQAFEEGQVGDVFQIEEGLQDVPRSLPLDAVSRDESLAAERLEALISERFNASDGSMYTEDSFEFIHLGCLESAANEGELATGHAELLVPFLPVWQTSSALKIFEILRLVGNAQDGVPGGLLGRVPAAITMRGCLT